MINKFELVKRILTDLGVNPDRLTLEWVSAAEAPRFVNAITAFTRRIQSLGPLGSGEGLDAQRLGVKLKAAKMALEGRRVRMVFARQAKYMKHEGGYRKLPSDHKLHVELEKVLKAEISANGLLLHLQKRPRKLDELVDLLDLSSEDVLAYFEKLEKKGLVESDRLIRA
ncbi:MAG: hydrogenase iron-sulfur subunit [Deltaproteobacteria bacterium]|nr:hydrogenase iron-sulfur subunit [Deltaproteobacteria bacterium]